MAKKLRSHLAYWPTIFWLALKRLYHEKYSYQASALAFETLLSLVPILSVMLYLASLSPLLEKFNNLASDYVYANFVPTSSHTIQHYLAEFTQQATRLPMFSILFSVVTGIMLLLTIESALNVVWKTERHHKRRFLKLAFSYLILILMPIFIGISVFLSTYLFSFSWFGVFGLNKLLLEILHLLINVVLFSVFYFVVPNHTNKWKDALLGGWVTAILFELIKRGFIFYVVRFPSYEYIYGTLSIIPIFLIWLYISWIIILFGALVMYEKQRLIPLPGSGSPTLASN